MFFCYCMSNCVFKKHLSLRWKRTFLGLCLFLALVPVALFKWAGLSAISQLTGLPLDLTFIASGREDVLLFTAGKLRMTSPLEWEALLTAVWLVVGVLVFIYRVGTYLIRRERIKRVIRETKDSTVLAILDHHKKKLKIKCPVTLYIGGTQSSPFTTGVLKPIIVIPSGLEPYHQDMVLRHELCHIKNGDHIYGFLRLFVLSLYWFNPLFYRMDHHIEKVSELTCDAKATKEYCSDQNKAYSNLIISMVAIKSSACYSAFNSDKKNIEERVVNIMHKTVITQKGKVITAILSCFIILVSSVPVLAYQQPKVLKIDTQDQQTVNISSDTMVEILTKDLRKAVSPESILYHTQIIDSNGNIYEVDENTNMPLACDHAYVDVIYEAHTKYSDGSCRTKEYDAQRCTECGHVLVGEFVSEFFYKYCPH